MHRLGQFVDGEWVAHSFPPIYCMPQAGDASQRIVAGVPAGDPTLLSRLVECMAPPYFLLYILHTSRGEGARGRYQSPPLSLAQVQEFLHRFRAFLSADARYDLWVHSPGDDATLVWDRHNQLFGYGLLESFSAKLHSLGFTPGVLTLPAPHEHLYREQFDGQAKDVLSAFDWSLSPLRPEDEQ